MGDMEFTDAIRVLNAAESPIDSCLQILSEVTLSDSGTHVRILYIPYRGPKSDISGLMAFLQGRMIQYCLSRAEFKDAIAKCSGKRDLEVAALQRLNARARKAFVRAKNGKPRSGECGEMLLFTLIEGVLGAPHLVSKMSLKTSPAMHFHGADAIHIGYDTAKDSLIIYFGESKMHAAFANGIREAFDSIHEIMQPKAREFEINLVRRSAFTELNDLDAMHRERILSALDPYGAERRAARDSHVILVSFDDNLSDVQRACEVDLLAALRELFETKLSAAIASAISAPRFRGAEIQIFLLPVESVARIREAFEKAIS